MMKEKIESKYSQIPIEKIEERFLIWKRTFDRGEVLNVFFLPVGDIMFRERQFVDWYEEKNSVTCKVIDAEAELISRPEMLKNMLDREGSEDKVVILAKRIFFSPEGQGHASVIAEDYLRYGRGVLILHEGFPLELDEYVNVPAMGQHRKIWSMYSDEVMDIYVKSLAKIWGLDAPDGTVEKIVNYCGGFVWLVNDVLRGLDEEESLFESESFWWKVNKTWEGLPDLYKEVLMRKEKTNEKWKEMKKYGLVDDNKVAVPVLEDWIERMRKKNIVFEPNKVMCNDLDLTGSFSMGERRMLTLLVDENRIVSRDELGKAFWQNKMEDEYSDWALDQVMSRLRKKCQKFNLPVSIVTKRGRGYVCE